MIRYVYQRCLNVSITRHAYKRWSQLIRIYSIHKCLTTWLYGYQAPIDESMAVLSLPLFLSPPLFHKSPTLILTYNRSLRCYYLWLMLSFSYHTQRVRCWNFEQPTRMRYLFHNWPQFNRFLGYHNISVRIKY